MPKCAGSIVRVTTSCTIRIGSKTAAAATGGMASAMIGVANAPSPENPPLANPTKMTAITAAMMAVGVSSIMAPLPILQRLSSSLGLSS